MFAFLDGKCPHKTKWCHRKLEHAVGECRGVFRWALGSQGNLHASRELWAALFGLVKGSATIKVTEEAGTVKSYDFTITEITVLHWFSVMTDMPDSPKQSKRPKPDAPILPVTLTVEQIAKELGISKRRIGAAVKCLAVMQLLLPVSTGHRGHPQYIATPYLSVIGRTAEIHSQWLTQYPEPVIGDVRIVDGKSYPADAVASE
ncbi:hypothetical protein [Streptomyces sp. NPDC096033]|uniref:hypothetical protein n=1 Tax=Streptomyces sp. NPDC096033 TaxID=3366071 RepID=UPI0038066316